MYIYIDMDLCIIKTIEFVTISLFFDTRLAPLFFVNLCCLCDIYSPASPVLACDTLATHTLSLSFSV